MKQEWKIRQALYHKLNKNHKDDLKNFDIQISDNIVENAIKYFQLSNMPFIYPSKSYVVAICYAHWLSKDFNENFYDLLNDESLLYNNDPYFKPYIKDKLTYDCILKEVMPINENKGIIQDIKKYYKNEFFIINNNMKELKYGNY
jgi:hypothetical protein